MARSIWLGASLLFLPLVACNADAAGDGGNADGAGGGATATSSSGLAETSGAGGEGTGGEAGGAPADPCPSFASEIVDVAYGPGAGFGQDAPEVVFGPPRGAGCCAGSLDVLSLGNGGSITLGFADTRIVDGEGPDFLIFENAFWSGGDPATPFAELGTVEVSADGEAWFAFACDALEAPFGSCAGYTPVYANPNENEIDPLDPEAAGGEAFDLADVGLEEARYVRIVDRADQIGFGGTFDLDAIGVVHGRCTATP